MRPGGLRNHRRLLCLSVGLLLAVAAPAAGAENNEDPAFLSLGMGYWDILDDQEALELRAEYRSGYRFWLFKPFGGLIATSDGTAYPHAGVLTDFYFGRRVVVSPSIAAGLYFHGGGKNLGHVVEFRSGIEFAYRFDDRSRLGLMFYHLSNAGLEDEHRGSETLSLTYSIPLR